MKFKTVLPRGGCWIFLLIGALLVFALGPCWSIGADSGGGTTFIGAMDSTWGGGCTGRTVGAATNVGGATVGALATTAGGAASTCGGTPVGVLLGAVLPLLGKGAGGRPPGAWCVNLGSTLGGSGPCWAGSGGYRGGSDTGKGPRGPEITKIKKKT